jgi:O-antigen biosynthesis protein
MPSDRRASPRSAFFHLDYPQKKRFQFLPDCIEVAGWYASTEGTAADRIYIKVGRRVIVCDPVDRPDVTACHQGKIHDMACGFSARFTLRTGLKRLRIFAEHDGESHFLISLLIWSKPVIPQPPRTPPASPEDDARQIRKKLRIRTEQNLRDFLGQGKTLAFKHPSARPRVSVLIAVWNQAAFTFACLENLRAVIADLDCEVLILDNASTDDSSLLWAATKGVRITRNSTNQGFLLAMNQLAREARGDHLLLLNNDATLEPGALHHALESIARKPGIGAVGARVIHPDGKLQEAGCTIWRDGTCRGYGRGFPADDPRVMDWKYTDYVSGVFLLTPRDTFIALGGFDESFAPAYYEDTDYCARLWQRGLSVVCDPRIVVHHFEFGSAGTEESALAQQHLNRDRFVRLHQVWLSRQPVQPGSPDDDPPCRSSAYTGHVLIIDDTVPALHYGAGTPRLVSILRHLTKLGWKITLYPVAFPRSANPWFTAQFLSEIRLADGLGLGLIGDFLRQNGSHFDAIFVSRPHNMKHVNDALSSLAVPLHNLPVIYDAEAVYALRDLARMRLTGLPAPDAPDLETLLSEETSLAANARSIIAVSPCEAEIFAAAFSGEKPIHVLGHTCGYPSQAGTGFESRRGLLFIGRLVEDNSPNVDSIIWFMNEVHPLMAPDERPRVLIIGNNQAPSLAGLNHPGITFLGSIDDLAPYYEAARVFIAPTRFAAGVPLKVVEAAAHRIPVVCTSILARQLGWTHEKEALVADTPADFAACCLRLHSDPILWENISTRAHDHYRLHFDPDQFSRQLEVIFEPFAKKQR